MKIHKIFDKYIDDEESNEELIKLLDNNWNIISSVCIKDNYHHFVEYVLEKDIDEDINEQHIKDALKLDDIINTNFYVGLRGKLRLTKSLKKEDYDFLRNYILPF
jgi:hypothetical protein